MTFENFIRDLVAVTLMRTVMIILGYVSTDACSQFTRRIDFIGINVLDLQISKPALDDDIVHPPAFAVHALLDLAAFQMVHILRASELASLIAVDDLRIMAAQCSFQAGHYKGLFQGAGKFKIDDSPAVPVDDDKKIHESF